jgi:epoxyqueuosine reductase
LQKLADKIIAKIGHCNYRVFTESAPPTSPAVIDALRARCGDPSPLAREHVRWALQNHDKRVV